MVIRLIQNLVGDTERPARRRSQPTHSWHSGDTWLTMRVTFFSARQKVRGQTWHPASDGNVSISGCGEFQVLKDLCHGLLHLWRRQFWGPPDGKDLVTTVRLTGCATDDRRSGPVRPTSHPAFQSVCRSRHGRVFSMRSSRQQDSPCRSAAIARNRYSPRSSGRRRGRMPSLRRRWSIHANDPAMAGQFCGTSNGKGFFNGMA